MAFVVPEFPLFCNIFPFVLPLGAPRLSHVPCNLAIGRRVQQSGIDRGSDGGIGVPPTLLLPGGTDVRDIASTPPWDIIEVPEGSHRYYQTSTAEPIGLGFPNWHVAVALVKASPNIDGTAYAGLIWPTPDPFLLHNFP